VAHDALATVDWAHRPLGAHSEFYGTRPRAIFDRHEILGEKRRYVEEEAARTAFTIEESVPGDSRSTEVTYPPPSLLTSAKKRKDRGLFVSSVLVTRNDLPLMLNTGDCLSPLPLIVFTTRAPGHSESGPGAFWPSRLDSLAGALSDALPESLGGVPAGALAGSLAGALTGALLGGLLATGDALA
jgi:hypothetical protein